jgi:hypothetical protein
VLELLLGKRKMASTPQGEIKANCLQPDCLGCLLSAAFGLLASPNYMRIQAAKKLKGGDYFCAGFEQQSG